MFVRKILPYLSFFLLSAALTAMLWLKPDHRFVDATGKSFPDMTITLVEGSPTANPKGYKLYNFFASWCIPCHAELPTLRDVTNQTGIPIIGINWDQNPEALKAWLDKNKPPFVAIYDDSMGNVGHAIGLKGLPETYLVDGKGMVRFHRMGVITPRDVDLIRNAAR